MALGGTVGMATTRPSVQRHNWRMVSMGGFVGLVAGVVGKTATNARGRALNDNFSYSVDQSAAQSQVASHNERLRQELGLSAEEAARATEPGR